MSTFTAFSKLPDQEQAKTLAEALESLIPEPIGVGIFEIEDGKGVWEVGGYFTETPDIAGLELLATIHGGTSFVVSKVEDQDWVAQVRRELTPVEAGRFWLYGSHDADKLPSDKIGLLIEAAMAFGTGHHGTTQGCLQAYDRLIETQEFDKVADIGCGTAVLAMAAKKHNPKAFVLASDIDEVATETARANLEANGLNDGVVVITAPGFEHEDIEKVAPFDLVFANILKAPLISLAPDMRKSIKADGYAILSGLLTRQADEVKAAYAQEGFSLIDEIVIGDWATLTLKKG